MQLYLVPDTNFRVTVYRTGLNSPRQLIYTPTGEILVTESSGNVISILTGATIEQSLPIYPMEFHERSVWHLSEVRFDLIYELISLKTLPSSQGYFYVATAGALTSISIHNDGDKRIQGYWSSS